jgi:hypothetical protein
MPALRTETVRTLEDYTQLVGALMVDDTQLWYRGAGKATHALKPGLYRHPTITDAAELFSLELKLLQRFRQRSIPYEERPFLRDEGWEYLFLMQHYGVPTRLLDWTENPYIGLYFAVTGADIDQATGVASEDACIWVLNPGPWNAASLSDISFPAEILSVPDQALKPFEPQSDLTYVRNAPVAIYGLHNSPRIVAQRGAFTVFGQCTDALDAIYTTGPYATDTLVQALIPRDAVDKLRRALFSTGITDSVVFPDLSGLALDIKRYFGFRV